MMNSAPPGPPERKNANLGSQPVLVANASVAAFLTTQDSS